MPDRVTSERKIRALAAELEAAGIDPGGLAELQSELDLLEAPPGLFARLTRKARSVAHRQWRNVVGEMQESAELMGLLRRRMTNDRPLSPEELDKVRSQLLDLMRVVPAGLLAAANSALPIPGTSVFTPWLLARLGLMPSRWREAHLLDQLRKEAARLHAAGHTEQAARVARLGSDLEAEANARERAAHEADLLTHWDANQNGVWDPEERAAYAMAVQQMRHEAARSGERKLWFLSHEGQVFGPTRLHEIRGAQGELPLLVCFQAQTGWIRLADIWDEQETGTDRSR